MTAVAPAPARRKKVSDRAAVARAVTAVRLAGPAGLYPAQVRDAMAACVSAAIAEGLISRGPAGVLVACPPEAFGGNSSHAIVRAGRLAERTHRLLRAFVELLERQALLRQVGVARDDEYFEAIIPDVDERGHQLWLRPDGERRP